MTAYANLHLVFEQMRIRARRAERGAELDPTENTDEMGHEPPRVLVIGPEHSGKTTACKILANYAVRGMAACAPLYINLDPSEVSNASMATFCRFSSNICAVPAFCGSLREDQAY
jgi:polyribonucleotide 5'-hydroxyl-kinase